MNVLLLVDNSTAMAGDISGGKKMELTQNAIAQYAAALPVGVNSGLVAYGSAGCEVPQPLVPVRPVNPKSFAAAAKTITTQGKAPLAAAMGGAEKIFGQRPGQSNRILVMSAGPDTCQGDPCAAATQLKQSSLGITIDVIGVGVDQAARSKLECIASGSGGLYYDASSVDGLRKAWDIQARKVEQIAASAGNARDRVVRYRECLSERREKFRNWAQSSGWADQHRPDFERIVNDLQEEGFRVQ
jgi:Ca-activated chloride channel family protein